VVLPLAAYGAIAAAPTVLGGLFNLFDDSEENHQRTMNDVAKQYQAYRPEMQANRYQAMQNQSAAFGPMQALMGQMYGPQSQMDFSKIVQNPFANTPKPQPQQSAGNAAFSVNNMPPGTDMPAGNFDYRNYQDFGGG
jgi:hypothetical protein